VASGDFSSKVSSQILDANVLFFIASHSHRRRRRHAPIHHHQETIFGPNDEPTNTIIHGAIDNDATEMPKAPLLLEEELKNGIDRQL
jgi:hypothetical protein